MFISLNSLDIANILKHRVTVLVIRKLLSGFHDCSLMNGRIWVRDCHDGVSYDIHNEAMLCYIQILLVITTNPMSEPALKTSTIFEGKFVVNVLLSKFVYFYVVFLWDLKEPVFNITLSKTQIS